MINTSKNKKINTITGSLNIVYEDFELSNSNGLNFNNESTYISGIINAESEHEYITSFRDWSWHVEEHYQNFVQHK